METKLFILDRKEDESGISGTGIVAEGVQFSNGKCVVSWLTEHKSIVIYDSIEDVIVIHGHGGKTEIKILPISLDIRDGGYSLDFTIKSIQEFYD